MPVIRGNSSSVIQTGAFTLGVALLALMAAPLPAWGQWTAGSGYIYYDGNVGIGTNDPLSPLSVGTVAPEGNTGTAAFFGMPADTVGNGVLVARTGVANPMELWLAANQGGLHASVQSGRGGVGFMALALNPNGGNVGIGTTDPQQLLDVHGTMAAQEIIVSTSGADYVFDPNYCLAPLSEVAGYIQEHHHLPDIPSAEEMQRKGASVGEMQAKLLAKIEELTLHMIEVEKENSDLKLEIQKIRQRIGQ